MKYYVERMVNGRLEWLQIEGRYQEWTGCFCKLASTN